MRQVRSDNMRGKTLLSTLVLTALVLPAALEADVGRNWEKLGEKTVERRAERDVEEAERPDN